jgi:hypothetical protein
MCATCSFRFYLDSDGRRASSFDHGLPIKPSIVLRTCDMPPNFDIETGGKIRVSKTASIHGGTFPEILDKFSKGHTRYSITKASSLRNH